MSRSAACRAFLLAATWACSVHATADSSSHLSLKPGGPPPGYHDIKTASGAVIRVADQGGFQKSAPPSSDENGNTPYDPENADFSRTSSFANKSFDTGQAALSKNETAEESRDSKRFITQGYATRGYNQADRAFQTVAYNDAAHPDAQLSKSFTLPAAYDANRTFGLGKKSDLQGKTALIGQSRPKIDPFSAPGDLTEKTFFDPTMLHVPHKEFNLSSSIRNDPNSAGTITDLPNRPLTVDEVRNLINHEQAPDLDAKPDGSSLPLNDPHWTPPDAAPPALDDRPVKPGPTTEDKSDELPSPGMMAQPADAPSR